LIVKKSYSILSPLHLGSRSSKGRTGYSLSQTLGLIIPVYKETEQRLRFLALVDELRLPVTKELVIFYETLPKRYFPRA
jgi:hypothetical protein